MSRIVRAERITDRFTIVQNELLDDGSLSWKAKGLLTYLLSKPPHWETRMADLVSHGTDGITAVRSAIRELEQAGYIRRTRVKREDGKFRWDTVVYDSPQADHQPPSTPEPDTAPEQDQDLTQAEPAPAVSAPDEGPDLLAAADELVEAYLADNPDAPSRAFQDALTAALSLADEYGTTPKARGSVANRVLARTVEHVRDLDGREYGGLFRAAKTLGRDGHRWLMLAAFETAHIDLDGRPLVGYLTATAKRLKADAAA